ncbi:hypothetical protein EBZ80_02695 [bacterium]|nr:hypothetical protein [bacterium]
MGRGICKVAFVVAQMMSAAPVFAAPVLADADPGPVMIDWGELMHGRAVTPELRPETPVEFEVLPERTERLSAKLRADPDLARIAVRRAIEKPTVFDQGVYGKLGSSTVYLAPSDRVGSSDRLYWTMVRVLSEKYGCFIVEKNRQDERFQFRCRDGRRVVMQRKIDRKVAHFWGRQYSANGEEVKVKPGSTGKKAFARMISDRRETGASSWHDSY